MIKLHLLATIHGSKFSDSKIRTAHVFPTANKDKILLGLALRDAEKSFFPTNEHNMNQRYAAQVTYA